MGVSLQVVDSRQAAEAADMERVLQQAQTNLMMNIPDLELTNQERSRASDMTFIRPDEVDTPQSPPPGFYHIESIILSRVCFKYAKHRVSTS